MKTIARKCSKITNFIARKCSNWYKMTEEAEKDLENVNKVNRICSNFVEHVNRICSNENIARKCIKIRNFIARKCSNRCETEEKVEKDL